MGYDKQSPVYLICFQEIKANKRVRCVKFTDSYDNNLLLVSGEDEQMVLSNYISNKYEEKSKNNQNTEEVGQVHHYPTRERKNLIFYS